MAAATDASYRTAFWCAIGAAFVGMVALAGGYGINWDEPLQRYYGESILRFYATAGADRSHFADEHYIRFYQGFFEVIATLITHLTSADPFDVRHRVVATAGVCALIFTGLAAREIASWRAAVIAAIMLAATPIFFGHAMFNSKDIPFAAAYIATTYFTCVMAREFPSVRRRTLLLFGIAAMATVGIRFSGIIVYALASAAIGFRMLQTRSAASGFSRAVLTIAATMLASYAASLLFWPYGLVSPIAHTIETLKATATFKLNDVVMLFGGRWIPSSQAPWYYVPIWFAMTTPVLVPVSAVVVAFVTARRPPVADARRAMLVLAAFAILPILFVMGGSMNLYDSWRQFLFIYPPLVALFAAAWDELIATQKLAWPVLALLIAEPVVFMVRNHPFEHAYFSPLAGGPRAAFGKYEIDYYGLALRQGVEWVAQHGEANGSAPVRVRTSLTAVILNGTEHLASRHANLTYAAVPEFSTEWDYSLISTTQAKFDQQMLARWPPQGTVHEITVSGAPILAVVKNPHAGDPAMLLTADRNESAEVYVEASLRLIERKDYANAIVACDLAIERDPRSAAAQNNRSIALAALGLKDDAIAAANAAIALDPSSALFKNNLARAIAIAQPTATQIANAQVGISLAAYTAGRFEISAAASRRAIAADARNARAFNNLCAAENALRRWAEGIRACEDALRLDPSLDLARNNLTYARSQLAGTPPVGPRR